MFTSAVKVTLHHTIRNDNFKRNTSLQCWNNVATIENNVATVLKCYVALKIFVANRPRITSPQLGGSSRSSRATKANEIYKKACCTCQVVVLLIVRWCYTRQFATTISSVIQRCNIECNFVSSGCNIVPTLEPCVALKIVVAKRPV